MDFEGPKIFEEKVVTARKDHKCCECRVTIKPREQYMRHSGLWEDSWSTYRTCRACYTVYEEAIKKVNYFKYTYGNLHGTLVEYDL